MLVHPVFMVAIAVYLTLAMLIGFLGRRRKLGAWGYFFGSLVLTPIIGIMLLMMSSPRKRMVRS